TNYQLNWNHPNNRFRGAAAFRVDNDWYPASFGPLAADTWYHLTATLDGAALRAYVNGVLITINSTAQGPASYESRTLTFGRHCAAAQFFAGEVDDVRIYNRALKRAEIEAVMQRHPLLAWNPSPANDAVVPLEDVNDLSWSAAETAVSHDVYLGTDANIVEAADVNSAVYWGRVAETRFPLAGVVESVGRYFWRIDEVEADGVTLHKGIVWAFGVGSSAVIDDFEGYMENEGGRIQDAWIDGTANNTGATVALQIDSIGSERRGYTINQRMALAYDNSQLPFCSEVEREFAPVQDWTTSLANTLSVLVKGDVVTFHEHPPGVFTMTASGEDIWSNHDEFRYACRQLNGDGSISVRIDRIDCTHEWAKCGVMIRESLDPGSAHAAMYITPNGRRAFQTRPTNGTGVCLTAHCSPGAVAPPIWVKLQRRGDQFTASYSYDGQTWIVQPDNEEVTSYQTTNPTTIYMPTAVYVGLALGNHDERHVGTAVFSDVKTSGYVKAQWQVADIGFDHPGNSTDDLYLTVEDADGATATVVNPDPTAVNATEWTQWKIPRDDFSRVDLGRVEKVRIGVGGTEAAIAPGSGTIYLDDLMLTTE
ncbi:MAG: LamG-like jellyroll fold domain-containing protein, partial [Solirubrobacterales bacterium]